MRPILLRPLVNEKSMMIVKSDMYTFEVDKKATKNQIAKLIKEMFSVTPLSIKTINISPKRKSQRTRKGYYQTPGIKKAIIKIKKGQKIALFESASVQNKEVEVKTAESETTTVKEKKSLLKGTKVKIERVARGQQDLKKSHKEAKKKGVK